MENIQSLRLGFRDTNCFQPILCETIPQGLQERIRDTAEATLERWITTMRESWPLSLWVAQYCSHLVLLWKFKNRWGGFLSLKTSLSGERFLSWVLGSPVWLHLASYLRADAADLSLWKPLVPTSCSCPNSSMHLCALKDSEYDW